MILPDVYVAFTTTERFVQPFKKTAKFSVNGRIKILSTLNSGANCISVSDKGDVYVGGFENTTPYSISGSKIWKNGTEYFSAPNGYAVKSILTNNNDVYFILSGSIYKNGVKLYNLTSPDGLPCAATGIFIYGTDVYACGQISCKKVAIWKNGILINSFSQISNSFDNIDAKAIYVDSSGIYMVGRIDAVGKIWKNGNEIILPFENNLSTRPYGIVGVGSNIYISGGLADVGPNTGRLWRMDKSTNIINVVRTYPGGRTGISEFNGNLYVNGFNTVWKDNTIIFNQLQTGLNSFFIR